MDKAATSGIDEKRSQFLNMPDRTFVSSGYHWSIRSDVRLRESGTFMQPS